VATRWDRSNAHDASHIDSQGVEIAHQQASLEELRNANARKDKQIATLEREIRVKSAIIMQQGCIDLDPHWVRAKAL